MDNRKKADIEDIFTIDEYLQLFNISLSSTYAEIKVEELSTEIEDILSKINKVIKRIDLIIIYLQKNLLVIRILLIAFQKLLYQDLKLSLKRSIKILNSFWFNRLAY